MKADRFWGVGYKVRAEPEHACSLNPIYTLFKRFSNTIILSM